LVHHQSGILAIITTDYVGCLLPCPSVVYTAHITEKLSRAAAFVLSFSFQGTSHNQIAPRYKAAKRRRLQRVLGRLRLLHCLESLVAYHWMLPREQHSD
jgi:hypothetical protein